MPKEIIVRFIGLDLARCFAIALLLLAHICQTIGNPIGGNLIRVRFFFFGSLGGLAVTIFLILSGAVLELRYGKKDINYLQFITKRCLRIYPIYYLSLLFGIMIYFIRYYNGTGHFLAGFQNLGIGDIVLSITGGYAFVGKWGGPFVETSWFIALIMTMYILFPFLSREIEKRPIISISFLFLISIVSGFIVAKYKILPNMPLAWFPLCRVFEFSFGIYLAIVLPRISLNYLESSRRLGLFFSSISELSFPLFLIHYPLLFMINYPTRYGVNQLLAISLYVVVSLTVSLIILGIDKRILRSLNLEKINDIFARNRYG